MNRIGLATSASVWFYPAHAQMLCFLKRFRDEIYDLFLPVGCPLVTPVTALLIIGAGLVFVCSRFGENMAWVQTLSITRIIFVARGMTWNKGLPEIWHGEVWRLVSPILIHFSFFHLACNCFALWVFGTQFEWKHGPVRFLAFVVVAQVVNSLVVFELRGPYFGGISGACAAVIGFLLWRAKVQRVPGVKMHWFVVVLVFLDLLLTATGFGPVRSPAAHLTGLLFGFFIALIVTPAGRVQPIA